MISSWMLCFLIVGALLAVVGACAEAIVARAGGPRRAVWAAAMLVMCALPLGLRNLAAPVPLFIYSGAFQAGPTLASAIASVARTPGEPGEGKPLPGTRPAAAPAAPVVQFTVNAGSGNALAVAHDSPFRRADSAAVALWIALSTMLAAMLVTAQRRLRRARHSWIAAPDDVTALVSARASANVTAWYAPQFGPAVFGVRRPQVVIPEWTTELDEAARTLLLTHEASHIRSRDPLLLLSALALVVALPWNLPLLFAYRRLHRAVEHDCDARVLAGVTERRQYGRLLLDVAERLAAAGRPRGLARAALFVPAPMPGMGTYRTELEARLRALVRPVSTWRSRLRMVGAAVIVVAALLVACSVPSPVRIDSGPRFTPRVSLSQAEVRVMQPTPARGAAIASDLSTLDSVRLMNQVLTRVLPRARILQDSIIASEARRMLPAVFDSTSDTEVHAWLLVDEQYRAIRANLGQQFYSVLAGPPEKDESYVAATQTTRREQLIFHAKMFQRAFPGVTFDRFGVWSTVDIRQGRQVVRVNWSRYVSLDAPAPAAATIKPVPDTTKLPWVGRAIQENAVKFQALISRMAAPYTEKLLAESPENAPVLWLLLDQDGAEIAHASGRNGLYAVGADGRVPSVPSSSPATFMTPDDRLGIACSAFETKMPQVKQAFRTDACGMLRIPAAGRKIIVVFGVSHP